MGTPVSSNKTEIMLKKALNTITLTLFSAHALETKFYLNMGMDQVFQI
jgi:hypothetical protein